MPLQFRNSPIRLIELLLRCVQLPLRGHDQIDQPIDRDPPRANILPELLNIHATLITDFLKSGSASFQRMDGYLERCTLYQSLAQIIVGKVTK